MKKRLPLVFVDGLPESVDISGREVPIEYDWRVWLMIEELFGDGELTAGERERLAVDIAFGGLPEGCDFSESVRALRWFYLCGEEPRGEIKSGGISAPVCDIRQDWGYIYAAFLQLYNIDLFAAELRLHWWQFRALMSGLTDGCELGKIIGYRSCDLGRIKDKELRRDYARLKAAYRLDAPESPQDKKAAAGGLFAPPEQER